MTSGWFATERLPPGSRWPRRLGAHGLKNMVGPDLLAVFETGVRYQLVHASGSSRSLGCGALAPGPLRR